MCSFKWDKKYAELLHINVKVTYLPDPEFCKSLDNFLHRFRLDICEPLCGLLLLEEKTHRMKYNTSFSSLQKRSLDTKDGLLGPFCFCGSINLSAASQGDHFPTFLHSPSGSQAFAQASYSSRPVGGWINCPSERSGGQMLKSWK